MSFKAKLIDLLYMADTIHVLDSDDGSDEVDRVHDVFGFGVRTVGRTTLNIAGDRDLEVEVNDDGEAWVEVTQDKDPTPFKSVFTFTVTRPIRATDLQPDDGPAAGPTVPAV